MDSSKKLVEKNNTQNIINCRRERDKYYIFLYYRIINAMKEFLN